MVAEIDGGNLTDELLSEGEEERIIDGGASLPVMGPGFVHGPCHASTLVIPGGCSVGSEEIIPH